MEDAVGRHDLVRAQSERRAVEPGRPAAGFGHHQDSRHHVPGLQPLFPEAVHAPRGQVAQVEGGGAVAPDRPRLAHEPIEQPELAREVVPQVVGEAGDEHAAQQLGRRGDLQPPAVQVRAPALFGGEQLVLQRVVDGAGHRRAVERQPDGGAEEGIAVGVVGRAVEGIHEPDVARARLVDDLLLGDDVVAGEPRAQRLEDRFLAGAVDLGDEVDLPFVRDLDLLPVTFLLDGARLQHRFRRHRHVASGHPCPLRTWDCRMPPGCRKTRQAISGPPSSCWR